MDETEDRTYTRLVQLIGEKGRTGGLLAVDTVADNVASWRSCNGEFDAATEARASSKGI